MKKKIILLALLFIFMGSVKAEEKKNIDSYWSSDNYPLIYGASIIKANAIDIQDFDVNDARFRVFATDFEDGDLTYKITHSGEVDLTKEGINTITYKVLDSHGNETVFYQHIIIDNNLESIFVTRTIYTIPSVWNMDMIGVKRNNYGDRQHIGLYLPEGVSIKARIVDAESNLTIQFVTNDSQKEISNTLKTDGSWTEIKNTKNNVDYASIPLITSPILSREKTEINKVYTIELEYGSDAKELNYYHYKDNESKFIEKWKNDGNLYGFIENEVINMVVPISDIDKMTNYHKKCFMTLDAFLEYYQKVVDKMDEIIGLDLNPLSILDQNVRTKYLIRANAHGAGAAYYSGNHVGINSSSVASFFEMNWGGLHELAHGYQGSLGKGEMQLGEVGNNILGYYIQTNKDIYYYLDNWLGTLSDIETKKNEGRIQGKTFNEQDVSTKLYAIVNLFNYFESENTYAKMFKWYRNALYNGHTLTNQDAYVESIADIYNVNIIPYMDAWKIDVSDDTRTKLFEKRLPMINILKNVTNDELLNIIKTNENILEEYKIVSNEFLDKYKSIGNLKLTIKIDNIEKLLNKDIEVYDGNKLIQTIKIDSDVINEELPIGTYYVKMPVLYTYRQDYLYIKINNDCVNEYEYTYSENRNTFDNYFTLKVLGIYNTTGYELSFSNNYKSATIKMGGAMMVNDTPYVTIYDEFNNVVSSEGVKESYFDFKKGVQTISLDEGYTIVVYHPNKNKVVMVSNLTGEKLEDYSPSGDTTVYKIINGGIIKLDTMTDEDYEEISYEILKNVVMDYINNYKDNVSVEEIKDLSKNFKIKGKVIDAYNTLRDIDKKDYTQFIESLTKEETIQEEEIVSKKDCNIIHTEETIINNSDISKKEDTSIKVEKKENNKTIKNNTSIKEEKKVDEVEDLIEEERPVKKDNDNYKEMIIKICVSCSAFIVAIIYLRKYTK